MPQLADEGLIDEYLIVVTPESAQRFFFTPQSDPDLVTWIVEDMSSAPPSVGVSSMENILEYDQGAALSKVKVPVHLLNADHAPTDLPYWQKYKPDVKLTVMPGTGHFLMLERPEEFNQLLANTVREF